MSRPLIAVALLLVGTVGWSGPAVAQPQAGSPRVLVVVEDPARDAHFTNDRGLSRSDRRSIDMSRLQVSTGSRFVRFTVDVDRVVRAPRVVQIFLIDIMAKGYDFTQLMMASQSLSFPPSGDGLEHEIGTEGSDTRSGSTGCNLPRFSYHNGAHRWWVDVPRRCLPQGRARLRVYSQTVGPPASGDYGQYSEDTLRVPGRHDLGGTIPPGRAEG